MVERLRDDVVQLVHGPPDVVVDDDVVELPGQPLMILGKLEPLLDFPGALRRPLAQPPLELGQRSRDEDRHAAGDEVAHAQRACRLQLEQARLALRGDAVDLRAERAGALMQKGDVLEELAVLDAAVELLVGDEVVVDAVDLTLSTRPRRRRDGQLEVGASLEQRLDERALAGPRGAGDDEELGARAQRRSRPTSSARCRSDSPPTVFDWLIRHWLRNLAAFTRPNLGTAISMSNTFAVST